MPATFEVITVDPGGVTMTVDILEGSTSVAAYTAVSGSTLHTLPKVISTPTSFFLARRGVFTVSAKVNGIEICGLSRNMNQSAPWPVTPTIEPAELGAILAASSGTSIGDVEVCFVELTNTQLLGGFEDFIFNNAYDAAGDFLGDPVADPAEVFGVDFNLPAAMGLTYNHATGLFTPTAGNEGGAWAVDIYCRAPVDATARLQLFVVTDDYHGDLYGPLVVPAVDPDLMAASGVVQGVAFSIASAFTTSGHATANPYQTAYACCKIARIR